MLLPCVCVFRHALQVAGALGEDVRAVAERAAAGLEGLRRELGGKADRVRAENSGGDIR